MTGIDRKTTKTAHTRFCGLYIIIKYIKTKRECVSKTAKVCVCGLWNLAVYGMPLLPTAFPKSTYHRSARPRTTAKPLRVRGAADVTSW